MTTAKVEHNSSRPVSITGSIPDWERRNAIIAVFSAGALLVHLGLRFGLRVDGTYAILPLLLALSVGGLPLVLGLIGKLWRREYGSDLLAGISIVTCALLGEYLAGVLVVLMLSGGEALESYALQRASSVLSALAQRMPNLAHRQDGDIMRDIPLSEVQVGYVLMVYPHEICPVDGIVVNGRGGMDESYLTGEPFQITKTLGSAVISGAINGEAVLTIRATKQASDSRYAKIMEVMRESETRRPQLRRIGDQLGAIYTPLALAIALVAWALSGDPIRFLAVLVIATPCPLLIAIPVAIIGSISLCARQAIIIKSPVVLEQITQCRTAIFDKTGTLTYGTPTLTDMVVAPEFAEKQVLALVAGVEKYSKHPLARAVLDAAKVAHVEIPAATEISEPPGSGLEGRVCEHRVQILGRYQFTDQYESQTASVAPQQGGLECLVVIDGNYAATLRFRDAPRAESRSFIKHLGPKHQFQRVMILSGDRESEVKYLAEQIGITNLQAQKSPEEKLAIVRAETSKAKTLYVGDGINDAPAMMAATVGMAMGQNSDVTTEAASVVILDSSLGKVDEFMHISRRMRSIALQSAVGGMILSVGGMLLAASGHLSPVAGALSQEIIDVAAVLNALRAAFPPRIMSDL